MTILAVFASSAASTRFHDAAKLIVDALLNGKYANVVNPNVLA